MRCWLLAVACCLLTLWGCQKEENRYSTNYRCYFRYYTDLHPTTQLTYTISDPGAYVFVRLDSRGGLKRVLTQSNRDGKRDTTNLTTAAETEFSNYSLGAGDVLIIGNSQSLDGLRAYDGQCPNCLSVHGRPAYPLSWCDGGQMVSCAQCGVKYDLNNGAPQNGKEGDMRLMEYYPHIINTTLGTALEVVNTGPAR